MGSALAALKPSAPLLLLGAWLRLAAAEYITYDTLGGAPYTVGSDARSFTINGSRTLLLGGSFHPPRIAFGDWDRLLAAARADGLNHVQIYVFWNFHERTRGEYDFTPGTRADLAGFFAAAARAGLFVNVRIGPYVCAEWNGGGFPLWLKHVSNFSCARCSDPVWEAEMGRFVRKIAAVMEPFLARHGGPIIMAQIENELHSGQGDPYVGWCGKLAASLDLDIPWVMCNGASAANTINTCNGNSCGQDGGYADTHAARFPGQPLGWTEDWSWFTTWGGGVTNHPGPYMAQNIALWFAKGGSHHNYYMWYGGNHIERWAASGLTNQYGDGSNLHSDTLPNEPKKSHLASMHRALAAMNDALLGAEIQTRRSAVAVAPCAVDPEAPWREYGKDVCVDGRNGTGVVMCDAEDETQQWVFSGGVNESGTIMHKPSASGGEKLCVSGACDMLNVSGRVRANGCVPLPLVPCDQGDATQHWSLISADDATRPSYMVNAGNAGCLAGWAKSANPGDPTSQPLAGVHNCSLGWGSGTFKWTPNTTTGLIENRGKTFDARQGVACLSSQHPATAPVLAFEYKSAGHSAAFVQNRGGPANVSYAGSQLALAAGSISFILDGRELFNTEAVAPVTECNRSRTPIGQPLSWDSWAEPLPPTGGEAVRSATPMEQLSLTNDQTDYMFYTAQLPPQMEWDGTAAQINLTIGSIESNAFLLFLDGKFIGSANDHTKGPNHLTLSVPVASETASQAKVLTLLSASMGIQNFHGTNPLSFEKGILGPVTLGSTNLTAVAEGWSQRPFLTGELQRAADPSNSSIEWTAVPSSGWAKTRALTWLKASFDDPRPAMKKGAVLVLDAQGLSRGHFFVNGHDLGRFYTIRQKSGAMTQRYYYIPADTLVDGPNTLVLIDELGATAPPQLLTTQLEPSDRPPPGPPPPPPRRPGNAFACHPWAITDTDSAGCGRFFPRYHPKNAEPLAHNNDPNAPFKFNGVYHLFMVRSNAALTARKFLSKQPECSVGAQQASLPGVADYNSAIGIGHLASRDLATWKVLPPALVPGRWGGPQGKVGEPGGEATGGYYSGSATIVHGQPRIVIPAVHGLGNNFPWTNMSSEQLCNMSYVLSTPANTHDPWLSNWTEPIVVVDGRVDGVQPHGPGFDDVTHAWRDDTADGKERWLFAGQTTVCTSGSKDCRERGDKPEYLQLWASLAGADWSKGFESLGDFFPQMPVQDGIANCPDFWRLPSADLLYFGDNHYWLGNYTKTKSGSEDQHSIRNSSIFFKANAPAQHFAPGTAATKGYWDEDSKRFIWWGWVQARSVPAQDGVAPWNGLLTVAREVTVDWGPSPNGNFSGFLRFQPVDELASLRAGLAHSTSAWPKPSSDGVSLLPTAQGGDTLDIELNVTWGAGAPVPDGFGEVGLRVLVGSSSGANSTEFVELLFSDKGSAGFISLGATQSDGWRTQGAGSAVVEAPWRPRPTALRMRVLVDRGIVEAFGQGGAGSLAFAHFTKSAASTGVGLVWRPRNGTAAGPAPSVSLKAWRMRTGYVQ